MSSTQSPQMQPWSEVAETGRLLRMQDVVARTGLSRSQIYQMMSDGTFPPFIKLSPGTSALPESWLDAYIAEKAERAISDQRSGEDV